MGESLAKCKRQFQRVSIVGGKITLQKSAGNAKTDEDYIGATEEKTATAEKTGLAKIVPFERSWESLSNQCVQTKKETF